MGTVDAELASGVSVQKNITLLSSPHDLLLRVFQPKTSSFSKDENYIGMAHKR